MRMRIIIMTLIFLMNNIVLPTKIQPWFNNDTATYMIVG